MEASGAKPPGVTSPHKKTTRTKLEYKSKVITHSSVGLLLSDVNAAFVDVNTSNDTVEVLDDSNLSVIHETQYISLVVVLVPT